MSTHLCSCEYAKQIFSDNTKQQEQFEYIMLNNLGAVGDIAERQHSLITTLSTFLERGYIPSYYTLYIACFRACNIDDKTCPSRYNIVKLLLKHVVIPPNPSIHSDPISLAILYENYTLLKLLEDKGLTIITPCNEFFFLMYKQLKEINKEITQLFTQKMI